MIFRNAKFHKGVDLSKSNFNYVAGANFLGCEIEDNKKEKVTNRETFRVIKHCFDSIGNHLEANKFFAEEMKAKKRELMGPLNLLQRFLLDNILCLLLLIFSTLAIINFSYQNFPILSDSNISYLKKTYLIAVWRQF